MRSRVFFLLSVASIAVLAFATPALAAGKPVQPGNATAEQFLSATACTCHGPLTDQWSQSMHAQAIIDPVFLTKVGEARAAAGDEVAAFCKRCHSPIGNMIKDPEGKSNQIAAEGVTCMFCHQVVGIDGKPANTSHLVDASLTRRAQLQEPAAPHPAEYSELHKSAEFCGGCHNVDHPTTGAHLESSYSEWAAGPYAKEGVVCQDCHMSTGPGVVGPSKGQACTGGPERDNIYSMTFVGANVGQGPPDASMALLQSAATLELSVPEIVTPGTAVSVVTTITNTGAGHYLPTGLTEVREMWLSVWAEDVDGNKTDLGEHRFGTVMKDAKGKYPVEMWDATAAQSDDRIGPRESVKDSFSFEMPDGAKQATVKAVLYYRSLPDDLASKAGVDNPTTEMASASMPVFASETVKDAGPQGEAPAGEGPGGSSVNMLLLGGALAVVAIVVLGAFLLVRSRRKPA